MSISAALLLAACLSGQEIWVYVENDPHDRSQHVLDAIQTPIVTLKERFPSPACQKYIFQLSCLRHDLREQCKVHLLTRDQAGVRSDIELPGYAFNARDFPRPLHPDVYHHWHSVPQHLEYLSKIREYDLSTQSVGYSKWVTDSGFIIRKKWFVVAENQREYEGVIDGHTYQIKETTSQTYLRFPPEPPLKLPPLSRKTIKVFSRITPCLEERGEITIRHNDDLESYRKIVEIIDMSTGIINQNKETP